MIGWRKFIVTIIAMAAIIGVAAVADAGNQAVWAIAAVATAFAGGNAIEHLSERKDE